MRSRASIKGHPIHPMLIPFPLAFLAGGFLFDLAGVVFLRPTLWLVGYYLTITGVGAALLAALPGFIDYFFTVPPKSSGKERATRHMLAMLTVVALFAIAWFLRDGSAAAPGKVTLALEAVGAGLLGIGGWMGGTLVSRNLISVDHRYADAGRWKESAYRSEGGEPIVVAGSEELEVNQMKLLHIAGKRIVLGRTEDGYVAFDDGCTHAGGSLAGGVMICGTVQCLWHGSQFDVATGKVKAGPAEKPIKTYQVEQRGAEIVLSLDRKTATVSSK
jgi:nitrite reductase/ring-hydroxylating ferredoxin subunit/uncharacterized membrane protein